MGGANMEGLGNEGEGHMMGNSQRVNKHGMLKNAIINIGLDCILITPLFP